MPQTQPRQLYETDLEELAYDLERARQIVDLTVKAKLHAMWLERDRRPDMVHWPTTTCLELAHDILSEAIGRLQAASSID